MITMTLSTDTSPLCVVRLPCLDEVSLFHSDADQQLCEEDEDEESAPSRHGQLEEIPGISSPSCGEIGQFSIVP